MMKVFSYYSERQEEPKHSSVSVVEAVNYHVLSGVHNLHNSMLRDGMSRHIYTALAIFQAVISSPEEAHAVAEKWRDLPEAMEELQPPPLFTTLVKEILLDLASR